MKSRNNNATIVWIDYKISVWLSECVSIFNIADNIRKLISHSMKKWKVDLDSGEIKNYVNTEGPRQGCT